MPNQNNKPHIFAAFHQEIIASIQALQARGEIPENLPFDRITIDPPRDANHGELSTNAAMILAKPTKLPPKILAEKIGTELASRTGNHTDYPLENWSVEGPGFLNWRLKPSAWYGQLYDALRQGQSYGQSKIGAGHKVNVEFVSANPTGPLHVANARGAVFGDVLARLLSKAGYQVTKEYYINDAGAQVDKLVQSLYHRYQQQLNQPVGDLPSDLYPGEYVIDLAKQIVQSDQAKWLTAPESARNVYFRHYALEHIIKMIMDDLALLGVKYDHIQSETEIIENGLVDAVLDKLTKSGFIYQGVLEKPLGKPADDWEERPQTLFRSTEFGDDQDRALRKSNGSFTYFAVDIAYHWHKYQRGFADMVNVWGADHIGYVKRLTAAVKAMSEGAATLDIKICQLVTLLENGQPVKMSKRSGNFIRLSELVEEVGPMSCVLLC